jgi:hypothetical protein
MDACLASGLFFEHVQFESDATSKPLTPKAEATRARIRAAAMASFVERGYPDTTIRLIAKEAGVSVGNAYYYFLPRSTWSRSSTTSSSGITEQ